MLAYGSEVFVPCVRPWTKRPEHSVVETPLSPVSTSPDTETVDLCPFDLMYARCWTHRFLVFHVDDNNFEKAIHDLNDGLSRLATLVPYIKGHVFKPSTGHPRNRLVLSWSPSAPPPKVRELPVPDGRKLPSLVELINRNFPAHYFTGDLSTQPSPWTTHTGELDTGAPVLYAGCTRIEGGLILSITNHHGVFDGVGSCDLIRMWAACTRGSAPEAIVDADNPLMRTSKVAHYIDSQGHIPTDRSSPCSITGPQAVNFGRGGYCRAKVFAFSGEKIQLAKQALNDSKLVSGGNNTVNNIIHAILWSCITRVRLLQQTQHAASEWRTKSSRLGLAVNGRRKVFGPEIAAKSSYLGNMTFVATAGMSVGQLDDVSRTIGYNEDPTVMTENVKSLVPLIESLATAAEKIDISHIGQVFSGIQKVDDVDTLARPIVPDKPFYAYEGMNMNCSSWANMDFYGCDFGSAFRGKDQGTGTPVAVRFVCDDSVDGAMMMLPRRRISSEEVIEVHVSLNADDLHILGEDQVLQSWLC